MNEIDPDVRRVLDAYRSAVFDKDLERFVALYDADVRVFDMWGRWSHDGVAAWRATAAGWFESLGSERCGVDVDDVQATVLGDMAAVHAFFTYRGLSADGAPLRALTNRMTMVLRRAVGTWRIVHEHSSAPIAFETCQAILQR